MEVWRLPLQIKECSGKPGGARKTFIAQALIKGHIKLKSNTVLNGFKRNKYKTFNII